MYGKPGHSGRATQGQSLFRAAQPRKLGVQQVDGFGGSFRR